jgi:outer membrane protein OmpU
VGYLNSGSALAVSYSDFAISIAPEAIEGLTLGYAQGDSEETSGTTQDDSTMYIKYVYGPVTVGYQVSERDVNAAASDLETNAYGITYAVSDNISVGYHTSETTKDTNTNAQESTGMSASYTMGSMTLAGAMNKVDNVAFAAADDLEGYEFTLSFAF